MKIFFKFIGRLVLSFVYSAVSVIGVYFGFAMIGTYENRKKN